MCDHYLCLTERVANTSSSPVPEGRHQSNVDENDILHFECGVYHGISIISANYGHLDTDSISDSQWSSSDSQWNSSTDSCSLERNLDIVRAKCDTYSSCYVAVTNSVFGNPCGNVVKYLEVTYECVGKNNNIKGKKKLKLIYFVILISIYLNVVVK